ncbi:MAG: hypothetical protein KDC11_04350, partial [Chitinophagaceae bacterium]|nr:hypothetical protein [Chitinophagaceae bacterium]
MKPALLIAISFLLPLCLKAQITLNSSNAPSQTVCQTNDTGNRVKLSGTLPDMSVQTNATWDFTTLVDSYGFHTFHDVASTSAFPSATFSHTINYPFAAYQYTTTKMFGIAAGGILSYGEHVDRQALPLGTLTGNPNDSLVFAYQDITYAPTQSEVKFPCTMSTTWTDVTKFTTAFNITVALYSLSFAPGERRSTLTVKNTVKGWGKMRVNDGNGNPTGYMDVLQIEQERTVLDSFFLNGSPAPTALLTAFGLTQGQISSSAYRNYVRAGEFAPLVEVEYSNNTFATIERCDVHRQRLAPVSVNDVQLDHINIYPNPVTNGSFTVKVDGTHKSFSY